MKQPNVLFLISDEHNAKCLGHGLNSQVKTPNLDRLAAEGTRFNRAVTQSPICTPSRICFASGQYAHKKAISNPQLASGYPWTPYRIEWRPTYGLDSREDLEKQLDALEQAGVKGWWYSAAAKGSLPLFRSKYLPHRDDADDELLQWVVRESHARGMAILSWEYINTAPLLAAQKPEWRYQWFDHDGDDRGPRDRHFVCYNSPYGQLLMDYCVEVVDYLGFDGLWFDGAMLFGGGGPYTACCCRFCKTKYREQTGDELPDHIDLNDPAFRRYINWRYRDFTDYWARLSAYVDERAPNKLIVINHFNRLDFGWFSGAPLWRSPMKAMIATEIDTRISHLQLHHKYQRAINGDALPTEVWSDMRDAASQHLLHRPEPDPAASIYFCQTAATYGGYMSFGLPEAPVNNRQCMTEISRALEPLQPYIGGEPKACIGLVLSGATKDFIYENAYEGWKNVHGAHNLLNALHWPSEVILDNMFDRDTLNRFQTIVLPDVRCLSDEAAANLRGYVEDGGVLLALGEVGTHNLNGDQREQPALDDLFGIVRQRDHVKGGARQSGPDDALGHDEGSTIILDNIVLHPEAEALRGSGLPDNFMVTGDFMPVAAANNADILATTTYNTAPTGKRWSAQGLLPPEKKMVTNPVILARNPGAGRAIAVRCRIGKGYAEQPHRRSREIVRRLLAAHVDPGFTTDAPVNVVVSPWQQDGRLVVHLLQVPTALLRFTNNTPDLSDTYSPEDLPALADFSLTLPGNWTSVHAPGAPKGITTSTKNDATTVTIHQLQAHQVVVFEE